MAPVTTDVALAALGVAAATAGGLVLAVSGTMPADGTAGLALQTVITAGPFGAFSAILLLRNREQQREHATQVQALARAHVEEREAAWAALDGLRGALERTNETLIEIRTILKERRNE